MYCPPYLAKAALAQDNEVGSRSRLWVCAAPVLEPKAEQVPNGSLKREHYGDVMIVSTNSVFFGIYEF